MKKCLFNAFAVGVAVLGMPLMASATVVPFEESFATDASGWTEDSAGTTPLSYTGTGGSDGGGYVSNTYNFENNSMGDQGAIVLRGGLGASGGAFIGDWVADGVTQLSAYVRHDAGVPMNFYFRVAPVGGPGAVGVVFAPVPSGVWTPISIDIFPGNPAIVLEGVSHNVAFGNVSRVQVGVTTPDALAGVNQDVLISLDQVAITPEPASLALLSAGLIGLTLRRKQTR